ncbi:hypothetical protein [Paenibacillus sacheonensis]|uniref:DUF697 domain-containing protein n=1 Tax=Paenibacillus sacheonensis TaxID=742054 RepID=A0A7X5C4N8_9BACL|nr:hypothetical protein [Paenibacillus sacheonensis]MBM7568871.1 uncharacterized protein (DUF697 family) [Paenibacillus sacheonensis]NBC72574.1 hypothetical protein [Paenibacillus sacheonensis]
MLPRTMQELEQVRKSCKKLVTRRAMLSGTAAMVPIPGTDMLADVGMLMRLIPDINKRFGLSEEQLDGLDTRRKAVVYSMITSVGSQLIGHAVTRRLVFALLKKAAARIVTKSTTKFVPVIGTAVAGALSFSAMKYVGNKQVDDCYRVAKRMLEEQERGQLGEPMLTIDSKIAT